MPKFFNDYSDERNKAWCIYCGTSIGSNPTNRDHVPSKLLLSKPFPENLAVVEVCKDCNEGYSLDEEYFGAFLSAVLSGTTNPEDQILETGKRAFSRSNALRERIEASRREQLLKNGSFQTVWEPEQQRISNILIKNARAHLFYENGEPMFDEPQEVVAHPIQVASKDYLEMMFPRNHQFAVWPEIGSRWMQRLLTEEAFDQFGFYVLQPDVYKYRLDFEGGVAVRSVLYNFLACSVEW